MVDEQRHVALGERLRVARTTAGLTQDRAAAQLGMSRTTLVAIEAGDREVRPSEMVALASVYRTSVNALVRRSKVSVDIVGQFRRNLRAGGDSADELEALQLLERLATSYAELEARVGRSPAFDYPVERPLGRGRVDQQAEDLATELRSRLGLGTQPIHDLHRLAELELGVRLFIRPLPSGVSGVFAYAPEIGACIALNRKHPRTRRNWTLAHEIGHFMTSRSCPVVDVEAPPQGDAERFADCFAAALLMPGPALRRAFADFVSTEGKFSSRHLILLAYRFHVSLEAMGRRLEQLRLLRPGTFEELRARGLNAEMVEQVLGRQPEEFDDVVPTRMALLGVAAFHRDLVSEEQLSELLGLERVATRALLDAFSDDQDLEP